MLDERYEDGVGDVSGDGGHKRSGYLSPIADDDDDTIDDNDGGYKSDGRPLN